MRSSAGDSLVSGIFPDNQSFLSLTVIFPGEGSCLAMMLSQYEKFFRHFFFFFPKPAYINRRKQNCSPNKILVS